jgi:hypothetical protein
MDRAKRAGPHRPGVDDPAYEARLRRTYVDWTSGMNVVLVGAGVIWLALWSLTAGSRATMQ